MTTQEVSRVEGNEAASACPEGAGQLSAFRERTGEDESLVRPAAY